MREVVKEIECICGDCLEEMKSISEKSVDMVLCDLPYEATSCGWDKMIPFEPLWNQYNRIIKDGGAIVLFGGEPFASKLRLSNLKAYKYDWVWIKSKPSNFLNAKKQPLRAVENICVFYSKQCTYNPQMVELEKPIVVKRTQNTIETTGYFDSIRCSCYDKAYPRNVLEFKNEKGLHPTQKPIALLEYLIKTYTSEGDTVLDNCAGSMSTGVACIRTRRKGIMIEKDEHYFDVGVERLKKE